MTIGHFETLLSCLSLKMENSPHPTNIDLFVQTEFHCRLQCCPLYANEFYKSLSILECSKSHLRGYHLNRNTNRYYKYLSL